MFWIIKGAGWTLTGNGTNTVAEEVAWGARPGGAYNSNRCRRGWAANIGKHGREGIETDSIQTWE